MPAAGPSLLRTDSGPQEHARRRDGCRTRSASNRDNAVTITNEGDNVNRIFSNAVTVAGSLALIGGASAAAATPAGAAVVASAWGVSATGPVTIAPVALATSFNTPKVSAGVVYPGLTTGGILDRASFTSAFSQVGSPKVYFTTQPVDQLNASLLSTSCRSGTILGTFGTTTIQGGSIIGPSVGGFPGFSPIPLPRNPAPNTVLTNPQLANAGVKVTLNKQTPTLGGLTVTGIYITAGTQKLSLAVSVCGVGDLGPRR